MDQSQDSVLPTLRDFLDAEKINLDSGPMHRDEESKATEAFAEIPFSHCLASSFENIRSRATEPENSTEVRRQNKCHTFKETSKTNKVGCFKKITDETYPSDSFIELCLNYHGKEEQSAKYLNSERNKAPRLLKSCSARVEIPYLPPPSEIDLSTKATSRGRLRKMFGPFVKFNPWRNPLGYEVKSGEFLVHGKENTSRDLTSQKSLFNEFLNTKKKNAKPDSLFLKQDQHHKLKMVSSPIHLSGRLKLENKHGMRVFQFILDCPDEFYIAKTEISDNNHGWVYTFCSISKESSIVGQMQVSSDTCSEPREDGNSETCLVTEFVLYNIARMQERSTSAQERLTRSNSFRQRLDIRNLKLGGGLDVAKRKSLANQASEKTDSDSSSCNPNRTHVSALHPEGREMAAIVIQEPFGYKKENRISGKKLKIVIPSENHGLPGVEKNCRPSPLLQRWRLGGGCDCGGWDMGCPLLVLSSPSKSFSQNQELIGKQNLLKLFFEGTKENAPALTMAFISEETYAVNFHARLSALQAFSICVAALHGTKLCPPPKRRSRMSSCCDSLKELMDEESKSFVGSSDMEEEKKRMRHKGFVMEAPTSFMPNLAFSPIARV